MLAASTDVAVPWWQWALFIPAGAGIFALFWAERSTPPPAWNTWPSGWRWFAVSVAIVCGAGLTVLGLSATVWTLAEQPGG